jgi:hypothetical protein
MTIVPGRVVNGRVEVDVEDFRLPEGAAVSVVIPAGDEDEYIPTPEEEAELEAAMDEADRGEGIPAEQVLRELRELREKLTRR